MAGKLPSQRDFMRRLVSMHGRNRDKVCAEYAAAERAGRVARKSNSHALSADDYALALWNDGDKKGWLDG